MAARAAKGRVQRLSKDLTCSICLDLFKKPVSLPCDHTFCKACIAGFWSRPPRLGQGQGQGQDQAQDQGQNPNSQCGVTVASCPQCREVFPSQSCRPNRIVASIVESYCQGLEEGESLGTGRAAVEVTPQCARHQEDLKLFCEDDQELVCLVCGVSQEHKSHTLVCIQEAQQRCKTTLSNSISALRAELSTALECEREIEEEVKKLKPQLLLSYLQPLSAKSNKEIGAPFRNSPEAVLPSSGGAVSWYDCWRTQERETTRNIYMKCWNIRHGAHITYKDIRKEGGRTFTMSYSYECVNIKSET